MSRIMRAVIGSLAIAAAYWVFSYVVLAIYVLNALPRGEETTTAASSYELYLLGAGLLAGFVAFQVIWWRKALRNRKD